LAGTRQPIADPLRRPLLRGGTRPKWPNSSLVAAQGGIRQQGLACCRRTQQLVPVPAATRS